MLGETNDLTSPVGRDPIANMSHQVLSLSLALFLGGSISKINGGMYGCTCVRKFGVEYKMGMGCVLVKVAV